MNQHPSLLTKPWRCPNCGSAVATERLLIEEEGEHDELFIIRCPAGDLDLTVTKQELLEVMAQVVRERLS